jgi:hypothetical protein
MIWLCLFILGLASASAAERTNETVRLQGRVLSAGTNRVFKTESGPQYRLKRTPAAEALFLDTNLLSRILLLTGKTQENSFEVTGNLRSVKNGKVHDLFYYCDICSIASSVPGLCQCCREPSELREEPATTR